MPVLWDYLENKSSDTGKFGRRMFWRENHNKVKLKSLEIKLKSMYNSYAKFEKRRFLCFKN